MMGCTPYSEEEQTVIMNNPEEYDAWIAEYKEEERS